MQRALRLVAHGANGLCAIFFGVFSVALIGFGNFQLGLLLGGFAILAILNIYVVRTGAHYVVEAAPDESLTRRVTQRQLNRKLSMNAERIVIPARFTFHLFGWLFCASLLSLAIFLDYLGRANGWFGIIFLSGVIYFPIAMLPGASYIEINEEGVTFSSAYIKRHYSWFRIEGFQIIPYLRQEGVGIMFKPQYQEQTWWRIFNRKALGGFDSVIVSKHCGVDAVELLQLMKKFWDRAASAVAEATVTAPSSSAPKSHSGSVPKSHSRASQK